MRTIFRVVGTQEDLRAFQQDLVKEFSEHEIIITEPTPVKAKLNTRDPYRQFELLELGISIASGLATTAIYDLLKVAIEKLKNKYKLKIHEEK